MNPLIINLAPTGMLPTHEHTPHVPLQPDEIAADVAECVAAGVSMVHLHARNIDASPSQDPLIFQHIIQQVRRSCPEVIITASTSGRLVQDIQARGAALGLRGDAKPDMASLTLSSLNFANNASVNSPQTVQHLARWMQDVGVRPELEVFDLGMVHYASVLADKGLLEPPFYFNLMLGNIASAQASLLHLAALVNDLPAHSYWSIGGLGRYQTRANGLGVVMADGVRVGLEDNIWWDDARTRLATNLQLVQRVVAQAQALGRGLASPQQVRGWLGLKS